MSAADILAGALERLYRDRLGAQGPVALHEPWFDGNEWTYVKDCLDTGWVSSVGAYVDRFERDIARRCATAHCIAAVNGTCALHLALTVLGVGPGDLVICPALSFVATANAIAHCGAEPLFVDIDPFRAALDPAALEELLAKDCEGEGAELIHRASGRRIAALIAVHIFGHPADMEALQAIAGRYGLPLVEDAAEALGSLYRGHPCGGFGRVGVLSFNGNKTLTTGGGGALVTDDAALAHRLKYIGTTAKVPHVFEFDHDAVGYNYRLPNLNAALGVAQLEQLDRRLARKRRLFDIYAETLAACDAEGLLMREPPGDRSNHWLVALVLDDADERTPLLEAMNARKLQARGLWRPLPDLPMYRHAPRARSGIGQARDLASRLVNLPSSPQLVPTAELLF